MNIRNEIQGREFLLRIEGRMDYPAQREFREASALALAAPDLTHIVIDLAQVDYVDSAGLGMLLLFKEKAELRERKIILRNPTPAVHQVLKKVHFGRFFEIQH